jgi:cation diffusion facilitator family transporter
MLHPHAPEAGHRAGAHLHRDEGLRAALIATGGLLLTGVVELAIFFTFARSAGLLADAFHNLGDVSTTVAIAVAFTVSRRATSQRYPYGLHRAEDLAGLFVLLVMAASALVAGWESLRRMTSGETPDHLLVGMAAALVGVAGNEAVAQYKIRVGRRIGSVSLEADGQHSRQDGLVSLAAFIGLLGVAVGLDWADGAAGLLITGVIVLVLITTARGVLGRALDEVEPALLQRIAARAGAVPGVAAVHDVRARWSGRALWATLAVTLPADTPLGEAHAVAERVRHTLLHAIDGLVEVDIHMDPGPDRDAHHAVTAHHARAPAGAVSSHDHDGHNHAEHARHAHEPAAPVAHADHDHARPRPGDAALPGAPPHPDDEAGHRH